MALTAKKNVDENLVTQSVGFGMMIVEGWENSVNYALYEVSNQNIGIISSDPLELGMRVIIEFRENMQIPMVVHQNIPSYNLPEGFKRYRLISLESTVNFENLLPESNHRKFSLSTRHHYHVRFVRFSTEIPTLIDAKTFGAGQIYTLKTINISKSGFLLASPPGFGVPFNEATLLELNIKLAQGQQVKCLGKVVRCEYDFEHKYKRYGINISDFHDDSRELYYSYIDDIEHSKNRQIFRLLKISSPY